MELKYSRFQEAPWFNPNNKPVVLIGGAGGIGSWLTVLLTRAGFDCHVYDFDVLEELNMAGQCFSHTSIGKPKVEALSEMVQLMCNEVPNVYNETVTEETMTNNIVFSAFDNIAARRIMFNSWLREHKGQNNAIFIDGRLLAEQLTTYCIRGNDEDAIHDYLTNHLPDDSKIPDAPCAMKQTSHFAAGIADKMVRWFTNFLAGQGRNVPYKHEEFGPTGFTKQMMKAPARPLPEPKSVLEEFRERLRAARSGVEFSDIIGERKDYLKQQQQAEEWANGELEALKRQSIIEELRADAHRNPFTPISVDPTVQYMTPSEVIERFDNVLNDEQRRQVETAAGYRTSLNQEEMRIPVNLEQLNQQLEAASGQGHDDGTQAMPDLITGTPGEMEVEDSAAVFFTPPHEENSIPLPDTSITNNTNEQLPF